MHTDVAYDAVDKGSTSNSLVFLFSSHQKNENQLPKMSV